MLSWHIRTLSKGMIQIVICIIVFEYSHFLSFLGISSKALCHCVFANDDHDDDYYLTFTQTYQIAVDRKAT
jgi:hypothetical protein